MTTLKLMGKITIAKMMNMTNQEILREINSLPLEAQRQLEDFIFLLRQRYASVPVKTTPLTDLQAEGFVGMWRDRKDMQDSTAWVRNVREKHWGK